MTHEKQMVEPVIAQDWNKGRRRPRHLERGGSVSGHLKGGDVSGYDVALGIKREAWSPS
jgi:hypothetical protein